MRSINALWLSFFSRPLYRDVFQNWRGFALFYLFLLSFIQAIVSTAQLDAHLDIFVRDYTPAIVQQIPSITIRHGQASTPEEKAYPIHDAQTGQRLALIDTRLDKAPDDLGETPLFIGKTSLQYRSARGTLDTLPYAQFPGNNALIDTPVIISFLKTLSAWGAVFLSPFMLAFKLVFLILEVLFFSLFGWINLKSDAIQARYPAIFRLTAVGLSPAVLFWVVATAITPPTPVISFIYVLLAVSYISYAARAVKNPENETPDNDPQE